MFGLIFGNVGHTSSGNPYEQVPDEREKRNSASEAGGTAASKVYRLLFLASLAEFFSALAGSLFASYGMTTF